MLIDTFLPNFQFAETHCITISAPPDVIMNTIINNDPFVDKLTKKMMKIRQFPLKVFGYFQSQTPQKSFGFDHFLLLGKHQNIEVTYGLIGKFWQCNFGLVAIQNPVEFQQFATSGVAKLVMNFSITAQATNESILSTETRVFCPDNKTLLRFLPYWYLIRFASGIIRKRTLLQIEKAAELDNK